MNAAGTGARGAKAEDRALAHLTGAGLELIARNWRCRFGEIDLIMRDGAEVVFVEVRARTRTPGSRFASAAESIGPRKRARLLRAASAWLAANDRRGGPPPCRFDVIAFDASGRIDPARPSRDDLRWIRAAFDAD